MLLRSTAPVITSPLEVWPARPSPRTSPIKGQINGLDKGTQDGISVADPPTSTMMAHLAYSSASASTTSATSGAAASSSRGAAKIVSPPPRFRLVKGSSDNHPSIYSPGVSVDDANRHVADDGARGDNETGEEGDAVGSSKRYGPPRRPLTPNQLGRIAQSFGIVIPSLPIPSPTALSLSPMQPSTSRTRSPHTMTQTGRANGWLLTVIPPYSILLPLALPLSAAASGPSPRHQTRLPGYEYDDANADDGGIGTNRVVSSKERDRRKRWKRGRLLPLQPTMGSMLLRIAREYGLPSTQGINLYLVHQPPPTHLAAPSTSHHSHSTSISSATSSSSSGEEASGPQISAQTWTTLFAGYVLQSAASSRTSTPSQTPVHPSGLLGRDVPFPSSPLSMANQKPQPTSDSSMVNAMAGQHDALSPSTSSTSSLASASLSASASSHPLSSSHLPPTPLSNSNSISNSISHSNHLAGFSPNPHVPVNPIVGSIEFDVDERAGWYDEWRQRSRGRHTRKISSISDSGWTGEPPSGRRRLDSLAEGAMSFGIGGVGGTDGTSGSGTSGVRQLKLVRKLQEQDGNSQARFLRDLDANRRGSVPFLHAAEKSRSMSASYADRDRPRPGVGSGAKDGHSNDSGSNSMELELEGGLLGGSQTTLVEMDGALVELAGPERQRQGQRQRHPYARERHGSAVNVDGIEAGAGANTDEMLASPITLDKSHLDRVLEVVQEVRDGMEKRGSGLVMSDELDRLEQSESGRSASSFHHHLLLSSPLFVFLTLSPFLSRKLSHRLLRGPSPLSARLLGNRCRCRGQPLLLYDRCRRR